MFCVIYFDTARVKKIWNYAAVCCRNMRNKDLMRNMLRDAPREGAGGAAAPPDFGRSEGAAGRRRRAAACRITTCPPGFLTLVATLL